MNNQQEIDRAQGKLIEEERANETGGRPKLRRRDFLKASLAMSGLLVVEMLRRFLSYKEAPSVAKQAILGDPFGYPQGSVTPIAKVRGWLVRDEDGFYAMSAVCSHLGCLVNHDSAQDIFECPCHGSQFRLDGSVIEGPATESLRYVELSLTPENQLFINTQVEVAAFLRLQV